MTRITGARTLDVRARTSVTLAGSDAVHQDPDYSGAYVFLSTDTAHEGVGMTFTIGRGNDLCCAAIEQLAPLVIGLELEEIVADGAAFWRRLTNEGQLRWLGPEKGVVHLATAALVNAVWDLWARVEQKPLWQLVCDLSPEQFVACVDFRYLTDVLDRDEALDILRALAPTREQRIATAIPRISRRPAGSATTTRRCATCAAPRSPTGGAASRRRSASSSPTTSTVARSCARRSATFR
jgi:L-fuconate dehydratase